MSSTHDVNFNVSKKKMFLNLAFLTEVFLVLLINLALPFLLHHLLFKLFQLHFTLSNILIIVTSIYLLYKLRKYIKGCQFEEPQLANGKTVIISGANCGIGKALTKHLCLRRAHVFMVCRDQRKGIKARKDLIQAGCDPQLLTVKYADLADFGTVHQFCDSFIKEVGKLDILVCNAGIMAQRIFTLTKDGNELTYQANFLAHHLMTEKLLPLLEKSDDPRVVNVSSIAHLVPKSARRNAMNDINEHTLAGMNTYNRSKLAQVLTTKALSEELKRKKSKVRIFCCHPGNVHTNILNNGTFRFFLYTWLQVIIAYILKSSDDGAQTPMHICLSKKVVSGSYYHECKEALHKVHDLYFDENERNAVLKETRQSLSLPLTFDDNSER